MGMIPAINSLQMPTVTGRRIFLGTFADVENISNFPIAIADYGGA